MDDRTTVVDEFDQNAGNSTDLDRALEQLVAKGHRQKHLTQDDIFGAFPETELTPGLLDRVATRLQQEKIDLLNEEQSAELAVRQEEAPGPEEMARALEELDASTIDDPVRMYLREIGKVPLLTQEEEFELAAAMRAGEIAARWLRGVPPSEERCEDIAPALGMSPVAVLARCAGLLDHELRAALPRVVHKGDLSRERIINSNLRLVVSVAKRYIGRGMNLLDLVQEGNIGLIRAVEKFDHKKGYKFSTYATWWIRQAITRAIADQGRTIRIPVHMVEIINRLMRTMKRLMVELGREATIEEIAREMEIPAEKVREILKVSLEPVSLETPIGEEEGSHLSDFIADDGAVTPAEAASHELLRAQVESVLDSLNPRERDVLRLRFGLEDGRNRTLEEVGKHFNVTRERIRQIEAKALRKLRHPSRSRKLKDYLE